VLQTGVWGGFIQPLPDSGASRGGLVYGVPPISIDWRGRAKLGQDDEVLFSFSETHTAAESDDRIDTLVAQFTMSGFTRSLISGGI